MDQREVIARLRAAVKHVGSQAAWSAANNCTQSNVNQVLTGRSRPTPKVLRAMGLRAVVSYEEASV